MGIHPYRLIVSTDRVSSALEDMAPTPALCWPSRLKRGGDRLRLTVGEAVTLKARLSRLGFRLGRDYEFRRVEEAQGQLLIWDEIIDRRFGLVA